MSYRIAQMACFQMERLKLNRRLSILPLLFLSLIILLPSSVLKSQEKSDKGILIYGEALILRGRYQEASEKLIPVKNHSLWYYYLMGVANRYQGKSDKAIDQFRQAITFTEDEKSMRALSFLNLGQILMQNGKYPEAIDTLTVVTEHYYGKLILTYPKCPEYNYFDSSQGAIHNIADDAQYLIGECYEKLGDRQSALDAFAKINRFYPFSSKSTDANIKLDECLK
jgi:tetratricopeptide (TPR) repeat protein